MDASAFKKLFSIVSERNQFIAAFGGWFRDSSETIIVLDLQKSNYGNYFEVNVKIYVQGLFGNNYIKGKDLVKKLTGDVFLRVPGSFRNALDLNSALNPDEREKDIEKLFSDYLVPLSTEARTRSGLLRLGESGRLVLLPAVRKELNEANNAGEKSA